MTNNGTNTAAPYHIHTDVCVIGGGHAGCEAALACARNGLETVLFTMSVESIAMMPCNPHIGGSSKGHLVREIDALGGEMAKVIDRTFLQSKMLGVSKGPAVHSLRAQADKAEYSREMRRVLEQTPHLTIRQAEVVEILTEEPSSEKTGNPETDRPASAGPRVCGVRIHTGTVYDCRAAIICTGTYLNARCLVGEAITETGPGGMQRSTFLSQSLGELGIGLRRFKTGTPARMDKRSLDYSKMQIQEGDPYIIPFSFSTDPASIQKEQMPCYLTYTNEQTHQIIRDNIDRSPIYAGIIEGTGPRYCPSIEDKVIKFGERDRHQVFVEPEGALSNEMYIDGMSSSMPDDVQQRMYRTVPGLENCVIVRNAYAIEYDCINANILKSTLESKAVSGLYCAGQFNGSSGYEEAAAQGLMAGINVSMKLAGKEEIVLKRSEAYIGVLIDDLVSKDNREPYRMMTSRAEYRLLLRQDNADLRLRKYGHRAGLVSDELYAATCRMQEEIDTEICRLKETRLGTGESVQNILEKLGTAPIKTATALAELLCRPELNYTMLAELDPDRPALPARVIEQVETEIKYEGYIERQKRQVEAFEKMENRRIPDGIDYDEVESLRLEARQRLKAIRPANIGQAARLSGVTPADVSVLLIWMEKNRKG